MAYSKKFLIFGHILVFQGILNSISILKAASECYASHKVTYTVIYLERFYPTTYRSEG